MQKLIIAEANAEREVQGLIADYKRKEKEEDR